MLNRFRDRHAKRILWILAIVIIVAFGLSGASFYLSGRDKNTIGTINGKKITTTDLSAAIRLAQLQILLSRQDRSNLTPLDFERIGLDFLVLLWKADKENLTVTNRELKRYIANELFPRGKFNPETYSNFLTAIAKPYNLNLTARDFEEAVRSFIKIDKLFEKYTKVEIKPEEIKELYLRDNQKVKIGCLSIPYDKFKVDLGINSNEIENFYENNKNLFEREAKINIAYTLIKKDDPKTNEILASLTQVKTLKDLKERFSIEIKETGLIGLSDPIEEIGWQYQITQAAFELEKNKLSPPFETDKGILIVEKLDQQAASIPPLSKIENEVKEKFILENARAETKRFAQEILTKIQTENITSLKKLASQKNLFYNEPGYFKFYDYIEGLGIDPEISAAAFSLKKDEIEPNFFIREAAIYLIQLIEKTEIDQADFEKNKLAYQNELFESKRLSKRIQFLERITREANLSLSLQSKN